MNKKLGAGIWGAGWVSSEHLRAWNNNPNCEIVAMGSRREESVRDRLTETGIKDVKIYTRLDDLLKHPDLNVLSICLPANLQAEAAIKAAQAGKHIMVEKPAAKTPEELNKLREVVRETGVKSCVDFVLRWNPMVQISKRFILNGWLGKIIYSRFAYIHELGSWYSGFNWARTKVQGGSVTLLGGCHAIDAMLFLIDKPVKEVEAYKVRGHRKDFEYEPTIAGIVRFNDDTLGHIAASQELHMPYFFPIELMGSKGAIREGKIWSEELHGQTDWVSIPTIMPDSGDVTHHPFQAGINHLVDCILNNKESHASVEYTAHSHEVVFALDESARMGGKAVQLPFL